MPSDDGIASVARSCVVIVVGALAIWLLLLLLLLMLLLELWLQVESSQKKASTATTPMSTGCLNRRRVVGWLVIS
jgi:hypothetical protein